MAAHSSAPGAMGRDLSIDTLRAIACIALVSYHTVGHSPVTGLELDSAHWLSLLNATFIDMRMPLFSFLSGLVFVRLEALTRGTASLLRSKARRLLIPMLSVGVLFWGTRALMGYDQQPFWTLAVLPYAHFWFLQATFLIMASFLLINAVLPGRSTWLAAGLMGLGTLLWLFGPRPPVNLFSAVQAVYLMPFFMLGYLCAQTSLRRWIAGHLRRDMAVLGLLIAVFMGFALASGLMQLAEPVLRRALALVIGGLCCLCLLALAPRHAGLARIGGYSYTIYLFHVFFTAGTREGFVQIAPGTPEALVWMVGVLVGFTGPIALHMMLESRPRLRALFLGQRLLAKPAVPPARTDRHIGAAVPNSS